MRLSGFCLMAKHDKDNGPVWQAHLAVLASLRRRGPESAGVNLRVAVRTLEVGGATGTNGATSAD